MTDTTPRLGTDHHVTQVSILMEIGGAGEWRAIETTYEQVAMTYRFDSSPQVATIEACGPLGPATEYQQ